MSNPFNPSVVLIAIVAHLVTVTISQTTGGCNVAYQFPQVGQSVLLRSPQYPNGYGNNLDCQYTFSSPPGTQMTLSCTEFNVESSTNCEYDVLYFSRSGDSQFKDQEFFCGQGAFTRTTTSNALTMGFHTDDSNPSSSALFRFQCQITVQSAPPTGSTCNCGQQFYAGTRIVGGTGAAIGEFPWRVTLYSTRLGVFCGGTIISRFYVLTAAHCTNSVEPGDQIYVNVGDYDLSKSDETPSPSQLIPVDYIIQNSLYNDQTQDSDISLLRLQSPLNYSNTVSPACLPWKFLNTDFNGQLVTASGWGTQYFGGGISPTLKKVELPVLGTKQCAEFYQGSSITVTNNMICTYAPGRDTCQGDSGGSIDYRDSSNGRMYAIGVVSQGISCGQVNQPGTYTKLTNYLNWIQGNTGETFCKV